MLSPAGSQGRGGGSVAAEYWRRARCLDGMDAARRLCADDRGRGASEQVSAPIGELVRSA
jgi:hypothetical protein